MSNKGHDAVDQTRVTGGDGQDLLAHPRVWRRMLVGLLVSITALPLVSLPWIAGWLAVWLATTFAEQKIAKPAGYIAADPAGAAVSLCLSLTQAAAAATFIQLGDESARFFSVTLVGFSSVNILLRYYAAPRLLIVTMTPYAAVLSWVCWGHFEAGLAHGQFLLALTPVATLTLCFILVWPTQRRLMDAWLRLVRAKAQAQAEGQLAEEANCAKSDFLATMSHEIRTPLNGILGLAQALQADGPSPEQSKKLRVIRSCGETLLSILNDVLDVSKIEAGQMIIDSEEFDLEHAVRGAVAAFGQPAYKKGLTLAVSISETAKGTFRGDPVRLRQVLYNLVSNALKFTERGAVGISVMATQGQVVFEVADSGIGMAEGRIPKMFERFVQGDPGRTRTAGGAGLGLAICRELVELMGGDIRADSQKGRGSIFTVKLPLERVDEVRPPAWSAESIALEALQPQRPLQILAAEDNEVNRLVLTTLLAQTGFSLTVVENGREAVEAWRSKDWDLILMDIHMPVMDGVAATREIRRNETANKRRRTPILALTANAMPDHCAEYRSVGIDGIIPKPLAVGALFTSIGDLIEGVLEGAA
jgi:signal transduction histidine kinase